MEGAPIPIGYEAGWAPDWVWMLRRKEKSCSAGDRTLAMSSQLVWSSVIVATLM
jgi:hypothetical protein